MLSTHRFRRPAMLSPQEAEQIAGDIDPAVRSELAHTTAGALVLGGRDGAEDPDLVRRLITLVDTEGLDTVASMWSQSPADTLPGALWRLYLLREWTRRDPHTIAERYHLGLHRAEVAGVVAGVASPPGPDQIRELADAVLSGVFRGDLDVTLDRAAAFLRVLATGSAMDADWVELDDRDRATRLTRNAGALLDTATDLENAAALWRAGRLD
ncbi:hypothetical protein [Occultella kanbiaonis]|uniref:hypothetical protein n=1 Tax=Occultella kanbiaonis TaxID=2675754 RepID=UPI001E3B47DE|nr:hypothetical protein [Occultella kanbiaonis]